MMFWSITRFATGIVSFIFAEEVENGPTGSCGGVAAVFILIPVVEGVAVLKRRYRPLFRQEYNVWYVMPTSRHQPEGTGHRFALWPALWRHSVQYQVSGEEKC